MNFEQVTKKYTITNKNGISVSVLNYGGIISSIMMPDKTGKFENIVLGFSDINLYKDEKYLADYPYFGAICGRYAGRIANGKFSLNGKEIQLDINHNGSHLHGGNEGFDKKIWDVTTIKEKDRTTLRLSYYSKDGEEYYPGNLNVDVYYILSDNNTFTIHYNAVTDKATPINLTNHTYFNLTGNQSDISSMKMQINASKMTPLNNKLVPTGEIVDIQETPLDVTTPRQLGKSVESLKTGYDFNYILDSKSYLKNAGFISDEATGRRIDIFTTQPAIQVYSGYYIPRVESVGGKFSGLALETQHFPDSPNHNNFPNTILYPREVYRETTVWLLGLI